MPKPTPRKLTTNERLRIRLRSGLADDTIRAIERGDNVREASLMRFERSCIEECIDLSKSRPSPSRAA